MVQSARQNRGLFFYNFAPVSDYDMDIICHAKLAVDAVGALQHIIIRGIERRKIYRNDGDRNNFLDRLGSILIDTRTQCYAWALKWRSLSA